MDSNEELMIAYKVVQTNPKSLISFLREHQEKYASGGKEYYYKVRGDQHDDAVQVAARFIFLNKTCYNGLYRVNKKGGFNVPYGKHENPLICNEAAIMKCHQVIKGVEIRLGTFSRSSDFAKKGNFYYLDPPYAGTYNGYHKKGFDDSMQENLKEFCKNLHKKASISCCRTAILL